MSQVHPLPPARPWTAPVALEDIPDTGLHVDLTADPSAREAIAKVGGLTGLPRLQASFDLVRHGNDGVHVSGTVSATTDQACVVTLEPIRSEVEEDVDLVFVPSVEGIESGSAQGALSLDSADPPEALQDGVVDLGAIATEFLLLGINPYPRKEGAVLDVPRTNDPGTHAFAALAALKKGPTGEKS